jgi:hypothetical protein
MKNVINNILGLAGSNRQTARVERNMIVESHP